MEGTMNTTDEIIVAIEASGIDATVVAAYAHEFGYTLDIPLVRQVEDQYLGSGTSLAEWAAEFGESVGLLDGLPEDLRYYFDYEAWARDGFMSGDLMSVEVGGRMHVFHT